MTLPLRLLTAVAALTRLCLLIGALAATPCLAGLTLQLGPASTGGGGPNPLSIPPTNILDYEIVYETKAHREWSVSVFPGIFYGQRIRSNDGTYISLGGGLVINQHGVGPGIYSAFGYQHCSFACFNIEYKQAIGITSKTLINPYAVRIGVTFFANP